MSRLVFFGTPDYVLPVLESLKKDHKIVAVITQPPKPVGRKKEVTPSPVALWAKANQIQVFDAHPQGLLNSLKKIKPEVGVLAAYGRIVPWELIETFPKGILNLHPSLLPRFRGASPVAAAIAAGEKETGVTIIRLDEEVDHGPIISQFSEEIKDDDTTGTLRQRLFKMAREVLATILPAYLEGRVKLREQDHGKATHTTLIKKEHGFIPPKYLEAVISGQSVGERWSIPFIKGFTFHPPSLKLRGASPSPVTIHHFIRAMSPWPGAWTEVKITNYKLQITKKRLKILKAHLEETPTTDLPAGALAKAGHRPPVTKLALDLVQLEGKNPVTWEQFRQGYPDADLS